MMMNEPQCIMWKRLGAESIREQLKGLTLSEELDFWKKQTEQLRSAHHVYRIKTVGQPTEYDKK